MANQVTNSIPRWHVPPPVVAAVALSVQVVLSRRKTSSKCSRIVGGLVGTASSLVAGGAVLKFLQSKTTIDPKTLATTRLVTTGPNRWTRNPMYLGTSGLLVAHAIVRRSWTALIPAAGYVAIIDRMQIPAEERALQERFGIAFEGYRQSTPRWL